MKYLAFTAVFVYGLLSGSYSQGQSPPYNHGLNGRGSYYPRGSSGYPDGVWVRGERWNRAYVPNWDGGGYSQGLVPAYNQNHRPSYNHNNVYRHNYYNSRNNRNNKSDRSNYYGSYEGTYNQSWGRAPTYDYDSYPWMNR